MRLDQYFDRIFYINLEKDKERDMHIKQQFLLFGINNYERVEALELSELPEKAYYRNFIKAEQKYIKGQLSCRASHLKCIRIAKERNYSKILILEDDATFLTDPNLLLGNNSAILNDWDMLYFGGLIEHYFRNQIVTTHAYAIRKCLYEDILNMAEASGMEIDNFYAKIIQHMSYNHNQSGKFNIRIILPFNLVVQSDQFQSNIRE